MIKAVKLSLVVGSVALAFSSAPVSAQPQPKDMLVSSNHTVTKQDFTVLSEGTMVKVRVGEKAQGEVTEKMVQDLISQAKEDKPVRADSTESQAESDEMAITIHSIVYPEATASKQAISDIKSQTPIRNVGNSSGSGNVSADAWYDVWVNWGPLIKKVTSSDNPTPAQQIISVAKGQTVKLTDEKTFTTTASISSSGAVPIKQLEAGITQEISKKYTTEITWVGPPEGSGFVSRIYYHTGYRDYGDYTISGKGNLSGDIFGPYTGNYKEPTYYVEWSRDYK